MSESTAEVIQKNNDVLAMTKEAFVRGMKLHVVLRRHLKEKLQALQKASQNKPGDRNG